MNREPNEQQELQEQKSPERDIVQAFILNGHMTCAHTVP